MADATYQPKVYRDDQGNRLNVVSGGKLSIESGSSFAVATDLEVASGGSVNLASGSSMTFASGSGLVLSSGSSVSVATALEIASGGSVQVASGGYLSIASGAYQSVPYQTLGTSQTATAVVAYGVSLLTGTTTGPTYTLTAPAGAGQLKEIHLNPTSSGVTHRAVIYAGTTGATFNHQSGSGNQVTLATSTHDYVRLISTSATAWRVLRATAVIDPNFSNKTT